MPAAILNRFLRHKTPVVGLLTSYHANHPTKGAQGRLGIAGKIRTNTKAMFSNGLLHMDTPLLANQQKLAFTISVRTLGDVEKTY